MKLNTANDEININLEEIGFQEIRINGFNISNVKFEKIPELKGAFNFVPGVMAMVLMLVSTLMTSIAIVREKELGMMEVLLVSPL